VSLIAVLALGLVGYTALVAFVVRWVMKGSGR
jgi:hypothetical protein